MARSSDTRCSASAILELLLMGFSYGIALSIIAGD